MTTIEIRTLILVTGQYAHPCDYVARIRALVTLSLVYATSRLRRSLTRTTRARQNTPFPLHDSSLQPNSEPYSYTYLLIFASTSCQLMLVASNTDCLYCQSATKITWLFCWAAGTSF